MTSASAVFGTVCELRRYTSVICLYLLPYFLSHPSTPWKIASCWRRRLSPVWECSKFDPSQNTNLLTVCNKNGHNWISAALRRSLWISLCENLLQGTARINTWNAPYPLCLFSEYFCGLDVRWLKRRGVTEGCGFLVDHQFLDTQNRTWFCTFKTFGKMNSEIFKTNQYI